MADVWAFGPNPSDEWVDHCLAEARRVALDDVDLRLAEWAFRQPNWEQVTAAQVLDHVIGLIDDVRGEAFQCESA